jgi:hypothetical protein
MPDVRDRETKTRRYEKKVKRHHTHDRRVNGRPPALPDGHGHDTEHVDHDQVGQIEKRKYQKAQARTHRQNKRGRQVLPPTQLGT